MADGNIYHRILSSLLAVDQNLIMEDFTKFTNRDKVKQRRHRCSIYRKNINIYVNR